jgi:hypothetical protein
MGRVYGQITEKPEKGRYLAILVNPEECPVVPASNQVVGSSNLSGRANKTRHFCMFLGLRDLAALTRVDAV